MSESQKLAVSDYVSYYGYQPIGPKLFSFYKKADIFINASLASEGFPRTIWEAMAHSLPVIATRVGSIPYFIDKAAVLVEPKSVSAIVEGIQKIIHDPKYRMQLIKAGNEIVKEMTLNKQTEKMMHEIKEYLKVGKCE